MEPSSESHLSALFYELDAKFGVQAATQAAQAALKARPLERAKEFPDLSRIDTTAARHQLYDADRQLSAQPATSWELGRTLTSARVRRFATTTAFFSNATTFISLNHCSNSLSQGSLNSIAERRRARR